MMLYLFLMISNSPPLKIHFAEQADGAVVAIFKNGYGSHADKARQKQISVSRQAGNFCLSYTQLKNIVV